MFKVDFEKLLILKSSENCSSFNKKRSHPTKLTKNSCV